MDFSAVCDLMGIEDTVRNHVHMNILMSMGATVQRTGQLPHKVAIGVQGDEIRGCLTLVPEDEDDGELN